MKLTVLGCGTSTGVPVIGCHCTVCASDDSRNRRTRSSLLVHTHGKNILIDTSTDLRTQALANSVERVDAVLFTHPHADHIHGIDDLRSFNMVQKDAIPCYGNPFTIGRIKTMFDYIFSDDGMDGWKPNLTASEVSGPFEAAGEKVIPIDIYHGKAQILGYRIGKAAYVTDCSSIPAGSIRLLDGIEVLVIGALRHRPHPTHFTIDQAVEVAQMLKPKKTLLTHLGHGLDYERDNRLLPKGVELAYDGMTIDLD